MKSVSLNLSSCKVWRKKNILNIDNKIHYWSTFGWEFVNNILIFEIRFLEFFYLQNFAKKVKMSKFRTRKILFGYFWTGI